MSARLRRGSPADAATLMAIKAGLPMPRDRAHTRRGGFLLGSDLDGYARLLAHANVWLLELDGDAVGFSTTLPDPVLRASPLWHRRHAIAWEPGFDVDGAAARPLAYFDQLAVLPTRRQRYWGAALALRAMRELIDEQGHELILTTTVTAPVVNRAALPYLTRVGARTVGALVERYPAVGEVRSAIHAITADSFRAHVGTLGGSPASRDVLAVAGWA